MVQGATATTARAVSEAMTGPLTQTPYIPEEFKPAGDATSVGLFNAAHDDQPYDPTPTQAQTLKMAYTQATAGVEGGLSDGLLVQAAYNEDIDPRTGRKKDDGVMQEALSQSQRLLQERLDELDAQIAQLIQEIEELEEENRALDRIQKALESKDPEQIKAAFENDPQAAAKVLADFERQQDRKANINDAADIAILHGGAENIEGENFQAIADKVKTATDLQEEQRKVQEVSALPENEKLQALKNLNISQKMQIFEETTSESMKSNILDIAGVSQGFDNGIEKTEFEFDVAESIDMEVKSDFGGPGFS